MRPDSAPLSSASLEAAADWLLQLHEAPDDAHVQAACLRWCALHPDHARAWQRARQLQALLQQVPPALALPVLGRGPDSRRRAALKTLGLWLGALPAGWVGWQLLAQHPAFHRSARPLANAARRLCRTAAPCCWTPTPASACTTPAANADCGWSAAASG